ncbi:MAG: DUF1292 domain-containing protein [Lachnospiraceae bacterium]|nr:DUF1292 domain-containing protein [Lachnospiraceae bacterium]MBQ9935029.1 DUF1292 domain-containing protein [Lachnospiraceae bacterium]
MENKDYEKLVFDTEDGEVELFVLEQTMLGGVNYVLVTEDTEDDEAGFLILKETPDEEDEEYSIYEVVEDESLLKSLTAIFNELMDDFDLEV